MGRRDRSPPAGRPPPPGGSRASEAGWLAASLRAMAALGKGPRRAVVDALLWGLLREGPAALDLAQAFWALGRMRYVASAPLAAALDSALEGCVGKLSNQALCQVLWSWRRTLTPGTSGGGSSDSGDACPLSEARRRALAAVQAEAEERLSQPRAGADFKGWEVVMFIDELHRLGGDGGPALLGALDEAVAPPPPGGGARFHALEARSAVLALRALVRIHGTVPGEVLEGLLARIEPGVARLSSSSLAALLKVLGELGHSPGEDFLEALRGQAKRQLPAFNESRLLDALAGFAALKAHPGQELLQRFTDSMRLG